MNGVDDDKIELEALKLYSLIACGNVNKIVEILISCPACIEWRNHQGDTPLINATKHGKLVVVELLLNKFHVRIDEPNLNGQTALFISVSTRHFKILSILLQHGADPNISDTSGQTPLCIACSLGDKQTVELLLQHRADSNLVGVGKFPKVQTALCLAVIYGNLDIVSMLIKFGANVNWNIGRIPLSLSIEHEHLEITQKLLESGASPNTDSQIEFEDPPLSLALKRGNKKAIELLLEFNADPNFGKENADFSALQIALYQSPAIAKLFLQRGANPNSMTYQGESLLFVQTIKNRLENMKLLIDFGANVNLQNNDGGSSNYSFQTPLHAAAKLKSINPTVLLLRNGAFVDSLDKNRLTPLNYALQKGNKEVAKMLLRCGAHPSSNILTKYLDVEMINCLFDFGWIVNQDLIESIESQFQLERDDIRLSGLPIDLLLFGDNENKECSQIKEKIISFGISHRIGKDTPSPSFDSISPRFLIADNRKILLQVHNITSNESLKRHCFLSGVNPKQHFQIAVIFIQSTQESEIRNQTRKWLQLLSGNSIDCPRLITIILPNNDFDSFNNNKLLQKIAFYLGTQMQSFNFQTTPVLNFIKIVVQMALDPLKSANKLLVRKQTLTLLSSQINRIGENSPASLMDSYIVQMIMQLLIETPQSSIPSFVENMLKKE